MPTDEDLWKSKEDEFSTDLALWKKVDSAVLAQFSTWEDHVEFLSSETIHQNPHEDYKNEMHEKIRNIYSINFKYFKGMPDFGDIMQDIHDYNDEIFYKTANLQVDNDPSFDKSLPREDLIDEAKRMLYDFNDYEMFSNLEPYIYEYLSNEKFFFIIPNSYYTYERLFKGIDVLIIVNDSQNILFQDFLDDIQHEVSPYYSCSQNVTVLMEV